MPSTSVPPTSQISNKRALSTSETEEDEPQAKRTRTPGGGVEAESPTTDKGKKRSRARSRRKKRKTPVVLVVPRADAPVAGPSAPARAGGAKSTGIKEEVKPLVNDERTVPAGDDVVVDAPLGALKEEDVLNEVAPESLVPAVAATAQGGTGEAQVKEESPVRLLSRMYWPELTDGAASHC
jgi:hypothetical protein